MNEWFTSSDAQLGAMTVLMRSLAVLPAGTSLTRIHPDFPQAPMMFGRFTPCYDDNMTVEGPHRYTVRYWVEGGDPHENARTLLDRWREWGWDVFTTRNTVRVISPDDYCLITRVSREGNLSIGVSSPCFPYENGENLSDALSPAIVVQR